MSTEEESTAAALSRISDKLHMSFDDPGSALTELAKRRVADSGDRITFERALEIVLREEPALAVAYVDLE